MSTSFRLNAWCKLVSYSLNMPKKLVFEITDTGCKVPVSHKLNHDGYFRKNIGNNTWVMYHRLVWEELNGSIPEGCEINHKCRNRACCNPEHLEVLEGSEHATETNVNRYAESHDDCFEMWRAGVPVKTIAARLGRTESAIYYRIRNRK